MTTERVNRVKTYNKFSILTIERAHDSNINSDLNQDNEESDISSNNKSVRKKRMHKPNRKHVITITLNLFSTNGAGVIGGKVSSLKAQVKLVNANVVPIQETHARRKGRIQIPEMVVFEAIRKAKGGGTLIASHKSINPRLIESYEDEFELLVVELELKEKKICMISGYGPQENWTEEKRRPFFIALETEVEKASLAGKSVILH